jgi:REP element-mobilizing transposase RayT
MPSRRQHVFRLEPLAFFLTWTTYGTWLPGDSRGWTDGAGSMHTATPRLARAAQRAMNGPAIGLSVSQRQRVEQAIIEHAAVRGWTLHAVQCRTAHVHVVVTATGVAPETILAQFKAWSTRALNAMRDMQSKSHRERVWTRGGSMRRINDDEGLAAVVMYVVECQDGGRYGASR